MVYRTLTIIVLSTSGANASEIAKSSVNNACLSLIFDWWKLFQQIHVFWGPYVRKSVFGS